ncbi:uncharacterized protein [Primulina eburnea]|uniref:uncharacterized protein n=1 Tax=Primulina eburnea TaxID=1245227 RepID=UPI003C6C34E4
MDLFLKAKSIRLRSHRDKFLVAVEDRESIALERDGSSKNTIWTIEFVKGKDYIRLKSCYGTYLTASSEPFLPGVTGKKVVQTLPCQCDKDATEWQPLRDGMQVRLRSFSGEFLRPNGGLPPWRNSVTHDIPHRQKTYDKVLWDVEVVETFPLQCRLQSDSAFPRSTSVSDAIRQKQSAARLREYF